MEELQKQIAALLATAAANDAVLAKDMSRSDKSIEEFTKLFYDAASKAAKGVGGNVGVYGTYEELIGAAAHYFHEDDVKELKLDSHVVCASTEKPQPNMRKDEYLVLCSIVLCCMAMLSFVGGLVLYALGHHAECWYVIDAFLIFMLAALFTASISIVFTDNI